MMEDKDSIEHAQAHTLKVRSTCTAVACFHMTPHGHSLLSYRAWLAVIRLHMAVACCHMTAHACGLLSYDYTWPSTWPWLAVLPVIFRVIRQQAICLFGWATVAENNQIE